MTIINYWIFIMEDSRVSNRDDSGGFDRISKLVALFANVANIVLCYIVLHFVVKYRFSEGLNKVQKQCEVISRMIADTLKKDKYDDMLSTAEQIFNTELIFLEKLCLKNKVNERISLDEEIKLIKKLKADFDSEYRSKGIIIRDIRETIRAQGKEKRKEDKEALESEQERFKEEMLSKFLGQINVQISRIRYKLFRLTRL